MPAQIDVVPTETLPEVHTETPLPASPHTFEDGRARTLLPAANDAVDRVLSADSAAFIRQSRQHEGE